MFSMNKIFLACYAELGSLPFDDIGGGVDYSNILFCTTVSWFEVLIGGLSCFDLDPIKFVGLFAF
jgi:hypothetical protein